MLNRFDHVTIAVAELEPAVRSYRALLGAAPVWQGDHPELGSSAALFGLCNALIELVAPLPGADEAEGLRGLVAERGEGLSALAFGTADAAACSQAWRARGLRATPPQPGQAHSGGAPAREYETVELSPRTTRGLAIFAVARPDWDALRGPDQPPASVPHALDHVVIRSADPDAAIALYGDALGIRLALDREIRGTRMLFFRLGGVTLEVVHDAAVGDTDTLWGAAYRVRDIEAAHARLVGEGVAVTELRPGAKPGSRVFTISAATHGVPTLMLSDAARI